MKTTVIDENAEAFTYNTSLVALLTHYGALPVACRIRQGGASPDAPDKWLAAGLAVSLTQSPAASRAAPPGLSCRRGPINQILPIFGATWSLLVPFQGVEARKGVRQAGRISPCISLGWAAIPVGGDVAEWSKALPC